MFILLTQHSTKTQAITKYKQEERLSWGGDNSFFFVVVVGFLYFHFLIMSRYDFCNYKQIFPWASLGSERLTCHPWKPPQSTVHASPWVYSVSPKSKDAGDLGT